MIKHTPTLNNFQNNLGAVSALIGKTETIHIVRAMNCHKELLKTLKGCQLAIKGIKKKYNITELSFALMPKYIKDALSKAESEG